MKRIHWNISAGAIVLFALAYFFDSTGAVSALLPAMLVHEAGHWAALHFCGARVRQIGVSAFGLEMNYAGELHGLQSVVAAAAGPVAGLLYALAAFCLPGGFWRMSGAVSLLLTVFNLLPVLPLDGGRIVAAVTDMRLARRLSKISAVILILGGLGLSVCFRSLTLLAMGIWLAVSNFRT